MTKNTADFLIAMLLASLAAIFVIFDHIGFAITAMIFLALELGSRK